jgi:hypothetical protein
MGGDEPITLDMDSSIFEVHGYFKEGARYSFKRIKGFHPLLCFWSEKRLLVGVRLRSGHRRSDHNARTFLSECLSRIPPERRVIVRLDGGFYSRQNVGVMLKKGLEWSISAHMNTALRREVEALPEDAWSPYPWEEETEWAEFLYQPYRWPRGFRLIVKRTPFFEGDQRVFGRYFYNAVITNRRGAGCSLFKYHFRRGGAENYIEEYKNGLGARMLPSQRFTANWAWLVISQLAYNLGQWFKLLLLPVREQSQKFKSLRLHYWCVAGRLVRSGRRLILSIAGAGDAAKRFMQIQSMILRL